MYVPKVFRQNDVGEIHRFIESHPLATLVVERGGILQAAHIPVYRHDNGTEQGVLRGHFARANPIWQAAEHTGNRWLAIFHNSGCYISPNWYPSKHKEHKAVPTWNYQAVHVGGTMRLIEEPQEVRGILASLSAIHESAQPKPWQLEDAPADYIDAMSKAVVCFEMEIETIEAAYKLSQNKHEEDRTGIIDGLQQTGGEAEGCMAEKVASFSQT